MSKDLIGYFSCDPETGAPVWEEGCVCGDNIFSVEGTGTVGRPIMFADAPVAAQPDVTQQTLDDVTAGIPARDAEIEALRKEIETLRAAPVKPYSLDLDPAGIRALTADAISGALALGFQGVNPPPNNEHWLAPFWEIGRESAAQVQQPVSGADGLPQGWRMVPEKIPMESLDDAIAWMRPAMNQAGRDLAYCLTGAWSILLDSVTPPDHLPDATKMVEQAGALSGQNQPETRKDTALEGGAQPSRISGELPKLTIQWHDTPEAVHRIFWEKAALENGMTYEELIEGTMVGETEHQEKVELTYEQEIQAIRDQKCWGYADTETNQIHVWAAPDVDRTLLIHMLAHEIGHLTGVPHTDDIQEELRAETFGKVAAMAYQMLQTQQEADKVDTALAEMVHAMFRSGNSVPVTRITIDRKQYDAAIDAARKELA